MVIIRRNESQKTADLSIAVHALTTHVPNNQNILPLTNRTQSALRALEHGIVPDEN